MQVRLKKFSSILGLTFPRETSLVLPFLVFSVLLKALISFLTWRSGFLEYDADGFTRSIHAWEWGQSPRLEVDAWLPLQFWLNGSVMQFWPDLFREPRLINLLASVVTTVNLFFIGRYLFGKAAGYGSALLASVFPWEIWFGLSGMSESLTHMFLSLSVVFYCRWLNTSKVRELVLTSAGLLGATMVRYEAWFYSLTYAAIVICLTVYHYRKARSLISLFKSLMQVLPAVGLAFSFVLIWVVASAVQLNSPLGFVRLTSKINSSLEEVNASISLAGRLFFYPITFFNLLRPLTLLAIAGSILLVLEKERKALLYLSLVWGEFLLFIISTLPTNNIAPGSSRYPVSNLMLLLPVVVYLFLTCFRILRYNFFRAGIIIFFLALPLYFVQTTLARDSDFPDPDTRQVALWFKEQTKLGKLPEGIVIPVHLPNPADQNGGDYKLIYGLTVLTNRQDGLRIEGSKAKGLRVISDISGFEKTILDDKPLVWVQYKSAGDEERITKLGEHYRQKVVFGNYELFFRPLELPLSVSPKTGTLEQHYTFTGQDFDPGEKIFVWVSYDNSGAKSIQSVYADEKGQFKLDYKPGPQVPGTFSITAKGEKSQRRAVAEVLIR